MINDVYHIDCEYCDKEIKGNDIVFIAKLDQDLYVPFCSSKCRDDYFKDCNIVNTLYSNLFDKEYYEDSEQYTYVDTYTVNNIVRMRDKYHKHATIPVFYGDGSPAEEFLGIRLSPSCEFGSIYPTYSIQRIKDELTEAMKYKKAGYTVKAEPSLANFYHVRVLKNNK